MIKIDIYLIIHVASHEEQTLLNGPQQTACFVRECPLFCAQLRSDLFWLTHPPSNLNQWMLPISDVRIRIRIQIRIQSIFAWIRIRIRIQTLKSWIRIQIQEKIGGFGFESGFELLLTDHNSTIDMYWLCWIRIRIRIQSCWIQIRIKENSGGFGFVWIRIRIRIRSARIRTSLLPIDKTKLLTPYYWTTSVATIITCNCLFTVDFMFTKYEAYLPCQNISYITTKGKGIWISNPVYIALVTG